MTNSKRAYRRSHRRHCLELVIEQEIVRRVKAMSAVVNQIELPYAGTHSSACKSRPLRPHPPRFSIVHGLAPRAPG